MKSRNLEKKVFVDGFYFYIWVYCVKCYVIVGKNVIK
jgi:hypothetical protein